MMSFVEDSERRHWKRSGVECPAAAAWERAHAVEGGPCICSPSIIGQAEDVIYHALVLGPPNTNSRLRLLSSRLH